MNSIKNIKPYICKKQRKTVDKFCPSKRWERRKSGDTIHSKLSCIIKRLDHLIDTYPSQSESPNDSSATNKSASTTVVANSHSGITCASNSSCNKEPIVNIKKKLSQKNVIPEVNTNAIPVKSPSESKSPNDCLAVVENGITIGFIKYSAIDPCSEVSCSKLSCNMIELVKNDCEVPSQDPVVPVDICHNEVSVKCLSETKVQHNSIQSTCSPVDIPTKQNLITPEEDCSDEKLCFEFRSIDLCPEVEDKNQKEDCHTVDNIYSVIKDDETIKNIGTKESAKLKSPVPVKNNTKTKQIKQTKTGKFAK